MIAKGELAITPKLCFCTCLVLEIMIYLFFFYFYAIYKYYVDTIRFAHFKIWYVMYIHTSQRDP